MDIENRLLRQVREDAQLSQSELAVNLGISQTQISRYEKQPGSIPARLLFKWLQILGLDPSDVFEKESRQELAIDPGKPYERIRMSLQLLDKYVDVQAPSQTPDKVNVRQNRSFPSFDGLKKQIEQLRRKPNVMMAGGFDTGKSYLANTLLGRDILPTSFQPATRVVTVVRHVDDRPEWQDEDVWLFNRDLWHPENTEGEVPIRINTSVLDDEEQCSEHRILAGSHDLLKQYGMHRDDATKAVQTKMKRAHTAVIYTDSALLHACTLIDLPGFGDRPSGKSDDQEKAVAALPYADLILYTSRIKGHLGGQDLVRLNSILRSLRIPEADNEDFPTLGNLFIIGTHADRSISDNDIKTVRQKSIRRLHDHLKTGALGDRSERTGREITPEDLRSQWFPFWSENVERSRPLVERLSYILGDAFPDTHLNDVKTRIQVIQDQSLQHIEELKRFYDEMAEENHERKEAFRQMKARMSQQRSKIQRDRKDIKQLAEDLKRETRKEIAPVIDAILEAETIKTNIKQTFDGKREAKACAPTLVLEQIESEIEPIIQKHTNRFVERVEEYLERFETLAHVGSSGKNQGVNIPFDAQGAFAGGLAGSTVLGGLALWASQLGPLGGYILVAKGVSALSALGFSIGGTAAATAATSAIGGPITLAIGLGTVAALGTWRLLSSSWEERLARKIVSHFEDEGVKEQFLSEINTYWDDTQKAFEVGADAVKEEFEEQTEYLSEAISNEKKAREQAQRCKAARDFYAGLPW